MKFKKIGEAYSTFSWSFIVFSVLRNLSMTVCPEGCLNEEGNRIGLRPLLHIPFDPDLFHELNLERYELSKSGKLLFNHPQGTNDERFWALALAVYAAKQEPPPPSRSIARTI